MNKTSANKPSRPAKRGTDLSALFNVAAQALAANQSSLNQADTENQNHGDNMVQTFNMIAQSMANQRGTAPSAQLQHASQYLAQNAQSGSGQVYAQGLAQAAQQLQGQKSITPDNAMLLIQSLLGGGQQTASQPGTDLLGALMDGQQSAPQSGGDLLGSLLGGQQSQSAGGGLSDGIDMGDLLNAGMAFMNAKQQGQDNLQAALSALMSAGPMAQKPHRQQSGQVVANALLQAIAGMSQRR
ncbi:MAG: DAK2 domain-containing protein [Anaerolineales bacterium]